MRATTAYNSAIGKKVKWLNSDEINLTRCEDLSKKLLLELQSLPDMAKRLFDRSGTISSFNNAIDHIKYVQESIQSALQRKPPVSDKNIGDLPLEAYVRRLKNGWEKAGLGTINRSANKGKFIFFAAESAIAMNIVEADPNKKKPHSKVGSIVRKILRTSGHPASQHKIVESLDQIRAQKRPRE